jgi:hypothetical protein
LIKTFIKQGETIYSFVFRLQSALGLSNYSNIINHNGYWLRFPKALKGTVFIYRFYDEKDLILLLRNTGIAKNQSRFNGNDIPNIYRDPTKYMEALHAFLKIKGTKLPLNIPREIRFCTECIREQVNKHGTGFFKGEWYVTKNCTIHNKSLFKLSSSNRADSINQIKLILKGITPNSSKELHTYDSEVQYASGNIQALLENNSIPPFAPCMKNPFDKWLVDKCQSFPNEAIKKLYIPHNKSIENLKKTNKYKIYIKYPKNKNLLYEHFTTSHFKPLEDFLGEIAEEVNVSNGVFHKLNLTEKLYKRKQDDCQRCYLSNSWRYSSSDCPADLMITRTRDLKIINYSNHISRHVINRVLQGNKFKKMSFDHSKFIVNSLFDFENKLPIETTSSQKFDIIEEKLNIILNSLRSETK